MTSPTAPTNLLAEIEAVRKRHEADAVSSYRDSVRSFNLALSDIHADRAMLLQALDGLMKGLSMAKLPNTLNDIFGKSPRDPAGYIGAEHLRASLGLTQGSEGE